MVTEHPTKEDDMYPNMEKYYQAKAELEPGEEEFFRAYLIATLCLFTPADTWEKALIQAFKCVKDEREHKENHKPWTPFE
jgi:hypothetical protein